MNIGRYSQYALLLLLIWFGVMLPLNVHADPAYEDGSSEPTYQYGDLLENLPEDAKELLPEGIEDSDTAEEVLRSVDSRYLWSLCTSLVQKGLAGGLSLFVSLLGVILVAGIRQRLGELFLSDKSAVLEYALILIAALQVYSAVYTLFDLTKTVIEQINQYMTALISALCGIFLLSGNSGVALVGSTWIGLLLTITEKLCYSFFFPLMQISFGGTLITSVSPELNLRPMLSYFRKLCTTVLVIFMTVITLILSFQTQLAAAADSLSMRGIKFAASNMIPMIGGLFSDTLRTIATSLSLVKSTAGVVGLLGLLAGLMIPLTTLFTARYSLSLANTATEFLDAGKLKPLFEEADKLVSFLISVLLMFGVFYLILLGVLIKTSSALGG